MKKVGIVVAMDEEFEAVENKMKDIQTKQIYNLRFTIGKIGKKECILVKSGVGKVHSARTTQVMIDNFDLEFIVNVGAAGSVNDMLQIGDVVIGKEVVQHDFDITAFGHSKGYITGVGNSIKCDEKLVEKLKETVKNGPERQYQIKLGVVATGDIFCEDIAMKNKIRAKFDADVVDMECGAIAQVAYLDGIPFIVIRSVSDTPDGKNANTFDQNLKLASKRCANLLDNFLGVFGDRP